MPVYFIKPIGMEGPVKIGCTKMPKVRLSTLDTWSPFPLEIAVEVSGGFDIERRFHNLFSHLHQRKEWFHAAPELTKAITELKNGTFDMEALPEPRCITYRKPGVSVPELRATAARAPKGAVA